MGWRILQISKPCKLSVKNRRLVYEPFEEASLTIPLEDISVVILENRQILLANSLLSELPEYDIVLFTCDFSHLPSGVLFPLFADSLAAAGYFRAVKKTPVAGGDKSQNKQPGRGVGNFK